MITLRNNAARLQAAALAGAIAALLAAGCASPGEREAESGACRRAEDACRAKCDEAFEDNPSAWNYQSCLSSCEPDPGAVCY